jgi:hypothetical protein
LFSFIKPPKDVVAICTHSWVFARSMQHCQQQSHPFVQPPQFPATTLGLLAALPQLLFELRVGD